MQLFCKKFFLCMLTISPLLYSAEAPISHYILNQGTYDPGFGSTFNTILGALDWAENNNMSIEVRLDTGCYCDPDYGTNWWEYYFEPINTSLEQPITVSRFPNYKKIIFSLHAQFQMPHERAHELIQKYVRIKPHIHKKVDAFTQGHQFNDRYIIGIHYRGTDKSIEAQRATYAAAVIETKTAVVQAGSDAVSIFIATDEQPFVDYMSEQFPGKIITYDATRSYDGQPVHFGTQASNYKKGEDALIDCLLLSKCNVLIKTASNLSDISINFRSEPMPVVRLNNDFDREYTDKNLFHTIMAALYFLDKHETMSEPGISMIFNEHGYHYDKEQGGNWWGYFFTELILPTAPSIASLPVWQKKIARYLAQFEISHPRAHELLTRYIQPRDHILARVANFIKENFTQTPPVGVLYAHSSWPKFQPTIPHHTVLAHVSSMLEREKSSLIFLATRDKDFSTLARNQRPTIKTVLEYGSSEPDITPAARGEHDLINSLILSRCAGVVGTNNVQAHVIRCLAPMMPFDTIEPHFLKKQI